MSLYWQKDLETMPRAELEAYQLKKLKACMVQAARSPFYGKVFREKNINPENLHSIQDITSLPLTTKEDLRGNFPYGFLTVPKNEIVRMHCTSGTTGNPTMIFYNRHDLESWSNLVARCLFAIGAREDDVFQNICGYGLFTGGLGFQDGAEKLGATTIPSAAGNSVRQIMLMRTLGTTVIHTIPSYLTRLYEVFVEQGLDPRRDTKLRLFAIGSEPHTEEQRRRIEEMFGVRAFNSFGMTEMNGPGVAFECECQYGMHVWEDAYIAEILDPDTLEPVPDGEMGELVMTTIDREAMPIIRYRTRDLTRFLPGECPCGRTHRRLDRFAGRTDDMFIIKGCNVFPMQIEKILMRFPEVSTDYQIVLDTVQGVDEMQIKVEFNRDFFTGEREVLETLHHKLRSAVRDEVLVTPKVQIVEPGALPRAEGKAVRVRDLREAKKGA